MQNLAFLTGEQKMIDAVKSKDNIEIIYSTVVTAYEGDHNLEAIRLINTETKEESRLVVDGVFLAIGTVPENEAYQKVTKINEQGYIEADERCMTSTPGVFVAGDCRTKTYRQVATAIAAAALNACRWLDG